MSPALDWRRHRVQLSIVVLAGIVALTLYDTQINDGFTIGTWSASPLDWLFIAANAVLLFYGVLPILADRERAATLWQRFREKPEAIAGAAWLVVVYLLGTVGLMLVPAPKLEFLYGNQPPVWGTIPVEHLPHDCAGRVADGVCHGSWQYPLGTDINGYAMEILLLQGLHVTLYVALISLALIVPLALGVGTVSGYFGGLFDGVSMRTVEVQDAVPPLVVYFLVIWITGESLLVIILLFGFLGWGGAARVVRSEAPVLLLTEAGLAFLGLEAFDLQSLGNIIARGVSGRGPPMTAQWWVSAFPAAALAATVVAFKLVGDALVEALDPRLG